MCDIADGTMTIVSVLLFDSNFIRWVALTCLVGLVLLLMIGICLAVSNLHVHFSNESVVHFVMTCDGWEIALCHHPALVSVKSRPPVCAAHSQLC